MTELKRLCPACGAANALERQTCHACGTNLRTTLPVPLGERLPVTWKQVGTSLALGAGALALRVGVELARQFLERKASELSEPSAKVERPAGRQVVQVNQLTGPQVRVWGRRMRSRWWGGHPQDVEVEEFFWQGASGGGPE
jgi:hypothetical protein